MTKEEIVNSVIEGRSFEGATIKGVDLTQADLRGGKFRGANFRYSILRGVHLADADLREANLRHVVLAGADLSGADLRGADLSHVNLKGANLSEAKLDRAILKGAVGISQNVFFTQEILDTLNAENKIEIDEEILTVFTKNNPRYHITPAARFTKVEDGEDTAKLLGKVKTEEEYLKLEVELYNNSAILDETVYTVESGFLGTPYYTEDEEAVPEEQTVAVEPVALEKPKADQSDEELLTDFLLKSLK